MNYMNSQWGWIICRDRQEWIMNWAFLESCIEMKDNSGTIEYKMSVIDRIFKVIFQDFSRWSYNEWNISELILSELIQLPLSMWDWMWFSWFWIILNCRRSNAIIILYCIRTVKILLTLFWLKEWMSWLIMKYDNNILKITLIELDNEYFILCWWSINREWKILLFTFWLLAPSMSCENRLNEVIQCWYGG